MNGDRREKFDHAVPLCHLFWQGVRVCIQKVPCAHRLSEFRQTLKKYLGFFKKCQLKKNLFRGGMVLFISIISKIFINH